MKGDLLEITPKAAMLLKPSCTIQVNSVAIQAALIDLCQCHMEQNYSKELSPNPLPTKLNYYNKITT